MAASDSGTAYSLLVKCPIDIIIGEPQVQLAGGELFETAVLRCGTISAQALWVELPPRASLTDGLAFPQLRIAHSRSPARRGGDPTTRARPRSKVQRAS
jgi:hypothetical protein